MIWVVKLHLFGVSVNIVFLPAKRGSIIEISITLYVYRKKHCIRVWIDVQQFADGATIQAAIMYPGILDDTRKAR